MTDQQPRFQRSESTPTMRFEERDGRILRAIYCYGGVLARRHLKTMFWPDASGRAMEMRLSLLYRQGYLDWPSQQHRRTKPIPEPICWLGWKGALWLAGHGATSTSIIASPTESKLRKLESQLRQQGLHWLREPRWLQLKHDMAVVDFRLAVERAVSALPNLTLEVWVNESEFLVQTDVVEYVPPHKNGARPRKRGVRPDGYFVIVDHNRLRQGLPSRARFLVEIDMSNHDTGSFIEEKVTAGAAYIQSEAYKKRFGDNSGCWLVVTTGETRLKHLLREANRAVGNGVFFFCTFEQLSAVNNLTSPIWQQEPGGKPMALLQPAK